MKTVNPCTLLSRQLIVYREVEEEKSTSESSTFLYNGNVKAS